ncbi:CotS family spore coat protein [Clostridioides difficile]
MNKFKYIDKKILCSYDLSEDFFDVLGVKVYDIIPLRKVFVLFTDKGKRILKTTNSADDRISFINKALNIVKEKDKYILQYCANSNGEIITEWKGKSYVLLDMIEGREANFTNPIEVEWCTKALARFHEASKEIINNFTTEEVQRNSSRNLIYEFLNDLCLIIEAERIISKFSYKNEFDSLFLQNVAKAKNDLNKSINLLMESEYTDMYSDMKNRVICHLDLAHHNFIIDEENVNIIDFDYCKIDIRTIDIYNFMAKVIKNYAYDKGIIKKIIEDYSSISEVSQKEKQLIFAMLNYPRDFVNIAKDYYLKQKSWDDEVFVSRFKDKIEADVFRSDLLRDLNKNLE